MRNRAYFSILVMVVTANLYFTACGGRTSSDDPVGASDGGPTTSATSGSSAMVSTGAGGGRVTGSGSTTGAGGVTTIGTGGSAGSAGSAGAGGCANVGCDAIGCGPGFISVIEPGTCCPVCKPVCNVACLIAPCPPGEHLETPPGGCCAKCVPDNPSACEQGQKSYLAFRSMLVEKYLSLGCTMNKDCTTVYESNRCTASCGVAIPLSAASSFDQNLRSFADMACGTCGQQDVPPCAPSVVSCVQNRCTLGGPR